MGPTIVSSGSVVMGETINVSEGLSSEECEKLLSVINRTISDAFASHRDIKRLEIKSEVKDSSILVRATCTLPSGEVIVITKETSSHG